jgi:glycosyltransferase involved in cell wall biosynthesis
MIGISITTRNRQRVLRYTLERFDDVLTDERVIVIDDNSDNWQFNAALCKMYGVEYIRNKRRLGIPRSKNRAFKKLLDCDYQFWFDDDCFPKPGWSEAFIKGLEQKGHLLYLHQWTHIHEIRPPRNGIIQFNSGTACFMAFRKDYYPKIMGFADKYLLYGHWHNDLSRKDGFYSIVDAHKYIHSFDMDGAPKDFPGAFSSCMTIEERHEQIKAYNK